MDWPASGFKQLTRNHKIHFPKLTTEQVEGYFRYRITSDSQATSDVKALEKGKLLFESKRVEACSVHVTRTDLFFTGLVRAAMKKKVSNVGYFPVPCSL